MKILFLSNLPTPYQVDFWREINKQPDTEAKVYFLYTTETNRDWILKLDAEYMRVANFSKKFGDYLKFRKFFKEFSPDVVLVGGYSLPLSNTAFLLAKISGSTFYYWLERPFPRGRIKTAIKNLYLRLKLPMAKGIFAIGKLAVEIYGKYSKIIFNLPYSLYLDKFYAIQRSPHGKVSFLFSGQLIERKNVINLVEAFKNIPVGSAHLTLIGSGSLRSEIEKIIGNNRDIELRGFVEPANLPGVFAENDVFVLPSIFDGMPVVISEAMAAGMPIIATKAVGGVADYIRHKENGYICDTARGSIEEGFAYYIKNAEKIIEQGGKNREIISNSLSDAKNGARYILEKISKT